MCVRARACIKALHWVPIPMPVSFEWAWVGTCHAMGGHRLQLMGVVSVWVQIRRKWWALVCVCVCVRACVRAMKYILDITKALFLIHEKNKTICLFILNNYLLQILIDFRN